MPDLNSHQIRNHILHHLKENPKAMDTPRGIARWWIGNCICPTEVEQVLEDMVEEGMLECVGDGERTLYRLSIPAAS